MSAIHQVLLLAFLVLGIHGKMAKCLRSERRELLMTKMYQRWMAQHGQVYSDAEEKEHRYKVFKENAEFIESFNANPSSKYQMSLNKFADRTNEEARAHWTGYHWPLASDAMASTVATPFRYENVTDVPRSLDWRTAGAVAPVKDQHSCGSCCTFASVAAIQGIIYIQNGALVSLSEQEILSCDQENDAAGCLGSSLPGTYDFIIRNGGLTTEFNWPYTGTNGTCNTNYIANKTTTTIKGYEFVPANDEKSLLKAVAKQPVSIGIAASKDFMHYSSGVFTGNCTTDRNHAVTIVGYGETEEGVKYWILKNSWGEDWGEGGYMRILRDFEAKEGLCGLATDASYPVL